MIEIETTISGIPCLARLAYYRPGDPGCFAGHPDGWYPPEPPAVEFRLFDRTGYPAPWLERKLSPDDEMRIAQELGGAP